MAIISKGAVTKGTPATFTLSVSELLALPAITDSYFQNYQNLSAVEVHYKSNPGNQPERVKFDLVGLASAATPVNADFYSSAKARGVQEVQRIVLRDYDGGTFSIPRSALTTANFDFSFAV